LSAPEVSVVIPTHNRCARLGLTIACALGQTGVDHEVIVVDDGSTDGTARYVGDRPEARLRLIRHETALGMSGARNAGAAVADGRFVAFLDDDDLWAPDKLLAQLTAVTATPGARWSAVGCVTVDEHLRITGWKRPPPSGAAHGALGVRNVVPGGGSGVLVDASLFGEVGGFDPRFNMVSDRDLWIRLAHRSPVGSVDRPLVAYVLHGSNLSIAGKGHAAELAALESKYGGRGERVEVLVDRATVATRSGQRATAVGLFLSAAVAHRDPRWVLRAASSSAGLGVEARVRRVYGRTLPRGWRAEAERWLAEVSADR
jgi:glycosyltransferase involved in cell wall biosynthesis